MPGDKTKGQVFPDIINKKIQDGQLSILLTIQITAEGSTEITVFKEEIKKPTLSSSRENPLPPPSTPS